MWRLFSKAEGVEGREEGGERGGVSGAYWAQYSTLLSSGLFQPGRKRRGVSQVFFFLLFSHSLAQLCCGWTQIALCWMVDTLENAVLWFAYLSLQPIPTQSVASRAGKVGKPEIAPRAKPGQTPRRLQASASASPRRKWAIWARHQQLIKNRRTQTNKVAASGVGGGERERWCTEAECFLVLLLHEWQRFPPAEQRGCSYWPWHDWAVKHTLSEHSLHGYPFSFHKKRCLKTGRCPLPDWFCACREAPLSDRLCDATVLFVTQTETVEGGFRGRPSMGGHSKNLQWNPTRPTLEAFIGGWIRECL